VWFKVRLNCFVVQLVEFTKCLNVLNNLQTFAAFIYIVLDDKTFATANQKVTITLN